jgi:hypothetical protein
MLRLFLAIAALLAGSAAGAAAEAATIVIGPSTAGTSEQFENLANALKPGDELVLRGGTYSQTGRRAIVNVNGTPDRPIVIRAAAGERPVLTRPASQINAYNNLEISNSSHLVIRGLRFKGGSIGIRFMSSHHITLENSEVSQTGNAAITLNQGNASHMLVRRNHIHHTGLSSAPTTGEGLYIGCNYNACRVTDSLFEGNYVHHLRGTSGGGNDGIEMKVGSTGNVIRNNVIHDTNIGTRYPCIFVYGGGTRQNLVEGNAVWNCGQAIQVVADAVVRNNLVLNSAIAGITAAPHPQFPKVRNVQIVNNTIYGHPTCLHLRWSAATNAVLANNAVYCGSGTAVNTQALGGEGVAVQSNFADGRMVGIALDGRGFVAGGSAAAAFRDPSMLDVWPAAGSTLRGRAVATWVPAVDFNSTRRTSAYDVGAYEAQGLALNPGWKVGPGFKPW